MWGLLFFGVLGIGAFIHSCKNDAANARYREEGRQNNQQYYFDNLGKRRRVDNNHPVCRTSRKINGNWDEVMVDMKTEKVIYNYSQDRRNEVQEKINNYNISTNRKRQEAMAEGKYMYITDSEPPILDGEYSDGVYARMYQTDPSRVTTMQYVTHRRRVSDNLLLHQDSCWWHPIHEAKCRLIIWDEKAEKANDFDTLMKHAKWNWSLIERWEDSGKYRTAWSWSGANLSRSEIEVYARKIDAYLPDIIEKRKEEFNSSKEIEVKQNDNIEQKTVNQHLDEISYEEQVIYIYEYYKTHGDKSFLDIHLKAIQDEFKRNGCLIDINIIRELLKKTKKLQEG